MSRHVPRGTIIAAVPLTLGLATLAFGETVHWRAARRAAQLPTLTSRSRVLVIVLGFGNRGHGINVVNRWRARIAVRTARSARGAGASVEILCSGGAVRGATTEAELLHAFITDVLGWDGPVQIELESRSTWENVANALPWIEAVDRIAFASNGLHAEKARIYLARQRPEFANQLAPAEDYRFGEMILLKPLFAVVGLWKLRAVFHVKRRM